MVEVPVSATEPEEPSVEPLEEEDEGFDFKGLIESLAANQEGLVALMRAWGENSESARIDARRRLYVVAGGFFAFLSVIVVAAAVLVANGHLGGDSFSFLIAVIVGSMITFVGGAVFSQVK